MHSTFSWLDYSEYERRKMLEVIELFGERVTRDELGLASVRDAFSDKLFPGTSTIQTRARYFLFVPWMYGIAEDKRWSSSQAALRVRKLEVQLIRGLSKAGDIVGVIGILAKENVRRLSSSIYWQGLWRWGIRLFPGSQEEYVRSLDGFYARKRTHEQTSREFDGESLRGQRLENWHPGLPRRPVNFPDDATFDLRRVEADFLREQILQHCPGSLLAFLVRERLPPAGTSFAWDMELELPAELAEWVEHGRNFSEVLHGASLLYNLMLSEATTWKEQIEVYRVRLAEWWSVFAIREPALRQWDRQRFWRLVLGQNPRVHDRTRRFVDAWIDTVFAALDVSDILEGQAPRNLVRLREHQLKGSLSRLINPRARELWQAGGGAAGADQVDLRWRPAQRILSDLTAAWER